VSFPDVAERVHRKERDVQRDAARLKAMGTGCFHRRQLVAHIEKAEPPAGVSRGQIGPGLAGVWTGVWEVWVGM
jgi:hypothetical protein